MMQLRHRNTRGVTLIELLVALSIFAVLGIFLFTLMKNSLAIYRSANSSGELYDKFDQATSVLADDLTATAVGDPEGRGVKLEFLLSQDRPYVPSANTQAAAETRAANQYSAGDPRSFLLRFVRSFPNGEMGDTIGRFAGTYKEPQAYYDGVNDFEESQAPAILERRRKGISAAEAAADPDAVKTPGLKPPANLMEVMYFLRQGPDDLEGTYSLYRAVRSPIGGTGSFFNQSTIEAMSPEWIDQHADPVVSGILHFGVVLWSQNTREWNSDRSLDGVGLGAQGIREMSELWWDSSRSRYEFFSLNRGAASAHDYRDDVFPSRAQIILTLVPEGASIPDARLISPMNAQGRAARIDRPDLFDGSAGEVPEYFRVDDEWMKIRSASGRDLSVERGARRTGSVKHDAGRPVWVGRTFRMTVDIPAHRSYFRGPGEKP